MNSDTVHASSWGRRRASHRSRVDSAKASDTKVAAAASATCSIDDSLWPGAPPVDPAAAKRPSTIQAGRVDFVNV